MKVCPKCRKKILYNSECECTDKAKKDSYKEYKKHRQDKDRQKLYSSKTWIRLRDVTYRKFMGLCIPCLFKGLIVNATTIHHIEDTKSNRDRWLDESNLVTVCSSCHELIHYQYESQNKKVMQDILFKLVKRFEKEYG